jgi:lipopolysaccharide/colanic/teichoic acid biosynthesis glycosyltransferase
MAKRVFDFSLSLLGLFISWPLFVVIGWMIKSKDGGPIFYRGKRTGRHGIPFRMYKFRTMVPDAEKQGGSCTADNDPRLTGIGRRLRKYKLDELPQLFNVFKGDMSLVGPRPEVQYYTDMFTPEERAILSVRPGVTDWASMWNPDEGALLAKAGDPEKAYMKLIRPTKIKLQLQYVRDRSFAKDLKIILRTLLIIIRQK